MLLDPKAFQTLEISQSRANWSWNSNAKARIDSKDLTPQNLCLAVLNKWQKAEEKKNKF